MSIRPPRTARNPVAAHGARGLDADVHVLSELVDEVVAARAGDKTLAAVERVRTQALELRAGRLAGGRDALAATFGELDHDTLAAIAHAATLTFQFTNVAEEQERVRALRSRDRVGATQVDGTLRAACVELRRAGASPDDARALLRRLFVMPVLTAHPTEARRRTAMGHLADVAAALEALDDPRPGTGERARLFESLRESVTALYCTDDARSTRPTPIDEVRAGLHVFERTLFDVTPAIVRELEDSLAEAWPGEAFDVGPFLRWGTWIGGDRDGNPNVTADVTRAALERHRALALGRAIRDADDLHRLLSVSAVKVGLPRELEASLAEDRARFPNVSRGEREAWRDKLLFVRTRLEATRARADGGYVDAAAYRADLALLRRTLAAAGLHRLSDGRLRDTIRRAEAFGFHLATMDLRQHSAVHESAVAELLASGGVAGYAALDEPAKVALLCGLLDRAHVGAPRDRSGLSPATRELLATLDVVGRARRDQGPEACERYVVSFTSAPSDLLEVLFLARAARLAPDELRPVPLLEQLGDLANAGPIASRMLELAPLRAALGDELEVMIGYSDSGKEAGYVASAVAVRRAQQALARVADDRAVTLTVFHGRGGAVGRGGGPANRAIRAQPREALRGRLRVTEQGETISARYLRREIARRDLELMVNAVIVGSFGERPPSESRPRDAALDRAATAARASYERLVGDRERLARYTLAATPIREVGELPIASRPASRAQGLAFEHLRAIPWVFSWNQSRHGVPGWYGLGSALDALVDADGLERVRDLYREWPFFRALVDNAQLALARADLDVAAQYARLAERDAPGVFALIADEHRRTVARVLDVTGERALLAAFPTIAAAVARRNPHVDVLNHAQIELLRRLRAAPDDAARAPIRDALFATINGIAAGLMTAG